jgi:polysaccharide export outer membrane protein
VGRGVYTTGILLAILLGSAGCSIVPSSGPQDFVVKNDKTASGPQYGLVKLNPTAIEILKEYGPGAIAATFPDKSRQQWIKFGIGDVVSVTIFEAAAGGLFIPAEAGVRPGNFVTLPNQNVDIDGNISVPYAGAIKAVGHTPSEIQAEIVKAIGNLFEGVVDFEADDEVHRVAVAVLKVPAWAPSRVSLLFVRPSPFLVLCESLTNPGAGV